MAVINGMAGLRDYPERLVFNPVLPRAWEGYRFKICYRGRTISVDVQKDRVTYELVTGESLRLFSGDNEIVLSSECPRVTV